MNTDDGNGIIDRKSDWSNVIAVIAVIISGFATIYVYLQRQDTNKAANAAESAVNIADSQFYYQRYRDSINGVAQNIKDSLFIASQKERDSLNKMAMIVSNRSFLVEDKVEITSGGGAPDNPYYEFNVLITNVGKTPAYDVHISKIKIVFGKIFSSEKEVGAISIDRGQAIVIGANGTRSLKSIGEIVGPVGSMDTNVCFFGKITYRDIFGKYHYTQFCRAGYSIISGYDYIPVGNLNKAD